MSFLLDTCIVSEPRRPHPAPQVLRWLEAADRQTLYLSVLTIGELEKGAALLEDTQRQARLHRWIADVRTTFADRLLPIDEEVARAWGRLQANAERRGRKMPVTDGLLAATAITHGLAIATRNGADMQASGARVVDPWQAT